MRRRYYLLKWQFNRWLRSKPRIAAYLTKRAKVRLIKDSLEFGMLRHCAAGKDSADLARGTAWVLRNERNEPITKVVLAGAWPVDSKAPRAKPDPDKILWERVEDGLSDAVVIARRGQALRAGRHPSYYGI